VKPYISDPDFTLYVGDSFQLTKTLGSETIDAIVTSPPYGDARGDDYPCAPPNEYADWIAPLLGELRRVLTPTGSFMLNLGRIFRGGIEHPYLEETLAAAASVGWLRIDTLIWHKVNANPSGHPWLTNAHEFVYWFAKTPDAYRGFDADTRTEYADGSEARFGRNGHYAAKGARREHTRTPHPDGAKPTSVFQAAVGQNRGITHGAPMALPLARQLVCLSTPRGGIVLDPFCGSGTTAVACRERGRRCVGFEILSDHAEECAERMGQLSLLAEDTAA